MELYSEFLIKRKYNFFDYLIMTLIVLFALFATVFLVAFVFIPLYGMFAMIDIFAAWFIVYLVITSRHVEFEYCVTEGVLDIDMIKAKKKRSQFVSVDLRNADIIAPVTEKYMNRYTDSKINSRLDASARDKALLNFFVLYKNDGGRLCCVEFTPNQTILDFIRRANPSNTFFE